MEQTASTCNANFFHTWDESIGSSLGRTSVLVLYFCAGSIFQNGTINLCEINTEYNVICL